MKRIILVPALCGALLLSGCSSLLDRPYVMVEPHVERPAVSGDSSTIQVDTYSELVNAVLFFVSQGVEEGTIQLTDYQGEVEEDLNRAVQANYVQRANEGRLKYTSTAGNQREIMEKKVKK